MLTPDGFLALLKVSFNRLDAPDHSTGVIENRTVFVTYVYLSFAMFAMAGNSSN